MSADPPDGGESNADRLFDRLEAELERSRGRARLHWLERMGATAATPGVSPELRLRFAARWLASRRDLDGAGRQRCDRLAYLWSLHGAHRGQTDAAILAGHCYRLGRGIGADRDRARRWYAVAAARGSSEARYWLRLSRGSASRWLTYRGSLLTLVGAGLLAVHATTQPPDVHLVGLLAYVLVQFGLQLGARALIHRISPSPIHLEAWSSASLVAGLRRRPWRLLAAAAEDGLILVPLLWIGVTPWSAALAGVVFGLLHYPTFSWRSCMAKGLDYFVTALVFLPWVGVWTIAIGHVLFDAAVVALSARAGASRAAVADRPASVEP